MDGLNDEYFERVLIKRIMTDNTCMALLTNKIHPEIFSKDCFGQTVKFFQDFFKEHGRNPKTEEIKVSIVNNTMSTNFMQTWREVASIDLEQIGQEFFLQNSERFLKRRMAQLAVKNIIESMKSRELDPDQLVDIFTKVAQVKVIQDGGYNIYTDIQRYVDEWSSDEARLSFGFKQLDEFTNGGMPANGKFLGVVAAPTNMGKSIFLGNIAVNAARQGKRVLVVSLEMSEMVYASRVYAALYDLDIDTVHLNTDKIIDCVKNERYGDMDIKEFPPASMTVDELDGFIDNQKKAGKEYDLICVDYLTLLRAPNTDNSNEAGKALSRKMRSLSYKYKIPFFTAAQVNREGFDGEPELQNMAESIAICSESDFIIMLHQKEEDQSQDVMRCSIKKSRLGRKDVDLQFRFNLKSLRFEDIDNMIVLEDDDSNSKKSEKSDSNGADDLMKLLDM